MYFSECMSELVCCICVQVSQPSVLCWAWIILDGAPVQSRDSQSHWAEGFTCAEEVTACARCTVHDTYFALTKLATKAWDTHTLKVIKSVQTGCTILTGTGYTLVYFHLTPETHHRVLAKHWMTEQQLMYIPVLNWLQMHVCKERR